MKTINLAEKEIKLITLREVKNEVMTNLNPKKASDFNFITGELLEQLPRKLGHVKIFNKCSI